jgi:hypothetical protein
MLGFVHLATFTCDYIKINSSTFGAHINDGKWWCDMALQGRKSLVGISMIIQWLCRLKCLRKYRFPTRAWIVLDQWKRYEGVLCFGCHMPLAEVLKARHDEK